MISQPVQAALLPSPLELGAPDKFDRWRRYQDQAVLDILSSSKRFVFTAMPCGSGKSLAAVLQQRLSGGRLVYLTSTKALQTQLMNDFEGAGLIQVKGQNDYVCRLAVEEKYLEGGRSVDVSSGLCHSGYRCHYLDGGCTYFDAVRSAREQDLVCTNYTFWMTQYAYSEGLGKFDQMVCDEGHSTPRALNSFLAVQFDNLDAARAGRKLLGSTAQFKDWKEWGDDGLSHTQAKLDLVQHQVKEMQEHGAADKKSLMNILREARELKDLAKRLGSLATAEGEWVVDTREHYVKFDPLEPSKYAEKLLFLGIKRVIVMSATLTPKSAERLGIKAEEMDFFQYPSTFPVKNRPIYRIPTASIKYGTPEDKLQKWDRTIDQIIEGRLDRKGIIHTVSYDRSRRLLRNSVFAGLMFFHTAENTRAVVQRFKDADPPAILVSPSVTTGFDFIGDLCRFQIFAKVPFPSTDSAVVKAWMKLDPDFQSSSALETLEQMYGRALRSEIDRCEAFCVDDNLGWVIALYGCNCNNPLKCRQTYKGKPRKHFASRYFLDAIQWRDTIPPAPPLEG